MLYRVLGPCADAFFAAGCAIHPLPENVTGFDTNNVVFHIRCEARDAIKHATIAFLLNHKQNFSERTVEEARKLKGGETKYEQFDFRKVDPRAQFYLLKYDGAAIAYDFTFDITEDNAAGVNANFLSALTHTSFGVAAGVSTDRQRETIRNFRISDTFGNLRKLALCDDPDQPSGPNYIYPIAGSIGLDEMVMTFVDLNPANARGFEAFVTTSETLGTKRTAWWRREDSNYVPSTQSYSNRSL
jgi:hypothetical protein